MATTRRDFLKTAAIAGTAFAGTNFLFGAEATGTPATKTIDDGEERREVSNFTGTQNPSQSPSNRVCVALIGCGAQGNVLLDALMRSVKICPLEIVAICDIWDWKLNATARRLKANRREVRTYRDYREMLAKEPSLDAVFIATPDFCHAQMTIDCLAARKHVYCEKMMAQNLDEARRMTEFAAGTPNLLVQIGHQRHSNPVYRWAREHLIPSGALGRITAASGVWNRAFQKAIVAPKKFVPDSALIREFGYEDVHQFLNWRGFKKYSGGPICDLGGHQIEIFNWFLGVPESVMAAGSRDWTPAQDCEWPDNVHCVFDYKTVRGNVRATYSVRTHTGYGIGYHEVFMGDFGSVRLAENPNLISVCKEPRAMNDWSPFVRAKILANVARGNAANALGNATGEVFDARATASEPVEFFTVPVEFSLGQKTIHQPHVENFLLAILGNAKLNCPITEAFANEAPIFTVNDAILVERKIYF